MILCDGLQLVTIRTPRQPLLSLMTTMVPIAQEENIPMEEYIP